MAERTRTVSLRLAQVADVRLGRQRAPQYEQGEHVVPYLRSANVVDGHLDLNDVKSMNFDPVEQTIFGLSDGDVLMTEGSGSAETVGTSAVWNADLPGTVCFQNTLLRLRPRAEVTDGRFLAWWARHAHASGQIAAVSSGANIKHIGSDGLKDLRIHVPALHEQRRIADFLDDRVARIDQIITARRQQSMAGENLFQARKESLLYSTPEAASLPLRRLRCLVQTGPFGSQLHSDEYVEDGWPVVNPACISRGRLHELRGMSVDEEVRARLARHVLREGDIVFGRRGELGRAGLVTSSEVGWVCGTGSLLVRLFDDRARPAFIMNLLSTSRVRHYFQLQSVGSTMDNLNTDILLSVPLMLPAVEQQDGILDAVEVLESESAKALRDVERSIDLLAEYRQSLITAAVTGEIDVTTAGSGIQG